MAELEYPPVAPVGDEEFRTGRLAFCKSMFISLSGEQDRLSVDAQQSLSAGRSIPEYLREIEQWEGPCQVDQQIIQARSAYMDVVLTKPTLRSRVVRKQLLAEAEEKYTNAILGKISAIVEGQSPEDALEVRQLPIIVQKTSFSADSPLLLKDFAANHLSVLLDTALQEHVARRKLVTEHAKKSIASRILGNHALRLGIAAGIFIASVVPEIVQVPHPSEYITHDSELALKSLSAVIFGIEAPEVVRLGYLDRKHAKRAHELRDQLAKEEELADLALRLAYSSANYGTSKGDYRTVSKRSGTSDKKENLERFKLLDSEFAHLLNDPGGKPYSGEQALGYAARFLIERKAQIGEIISDTNDPAKQKELYLKFCGEIIQEDLARLKKGVSVTRLRKNSMKAIGIVPAALFPNFVASTSDAVGLSRDTLDTLQRSDSE